MIKVNLLRDTQVTEIKKDGTFSATFVDGAKFGAPVGQKDLIFKIIILILPIISSFMMLTYFVEAKNNSLKVLDGVLLKKGQEKASLDPAIKLVNDFKKEKDKLQIQIDTIRTLSRERLRNVKALEALQALMPEKAWLTSLKIEENKAEIEGKAIDDKIVSDFMAALDENIYFSSIRLKKTADEQSKEGTVKTFEIESDLEGM